MIAYCYANGRIGFGRKTPEGALPIAKAPAKKLRKAVMVIARMSYPSKRGGNDEVPLVPGIPEANNQNEGLDALLKFRMQVRSRLN